MHADCNLKFQFFNAISYGRFKPLHVVAVLHPALVTTHILTLTHLTAVHSAGHQHVCLISSDVFLLTSISGPQVTVRTSTSLIALLKRIGDIPLARVFLYHGRKSQSADGSYKSVKQGRHSTKIIHTAVRCSLSRYRVWSVVSTQQSAQSLPPIMSQTSSAALA